jgi:hypothetical protein
MLPLHVSHVTRNTHACLNHLGRNLDAKFGII